MKGKRSPERKAKSALKHWVTAQKLKDNAKLIASMVFYIKRLKTGEAIDSGPIHELTRSVPHKCQWKPYLTAARRWLGIKYPTRETILLPADYFFNLLYQGKNLWILDLEAKAQFMALNGDLEVDDAVLAFSAAHPEIIERCKIYLEQDWPEAAELLRKKEREDREERERAEYEQRKKDRFWVPEEELEQPAPFNALDFIKGNIAGHLKKAELMSPGDRRLSLPHR